MIVLEEDPVVEEETEFDETLIHWVCPVCYPNDVVAIAFCGVELGTDDSETELPDESVDCVVCLDINECAIHPRDPGIYIIFDEVTHWSS